MNILVPLKYTVDANVVVRPLPDGSGVDLADVPKAINPFDEIALEAALRLKEEGKAAAVRVCAIGAEEAEKGLRQALAMGADEAVHVLVDQAIEAPDVAAVLAELARRGEASLVLMGKQAIDDDLGVTAQMLAARLGWPQAMFASGLRLLDGEVEVDCEWDEGALTLRLPLPCVVAADLRLAEPRFVSLPQLMKARRRPIERHTPAELGVTPRRYAETVRVEAVNQERRVEMLDDVDALIARLKERDLWPDS